MNDCKIPVLFDLMKEMNISQKQLSEAIGISQGNISDWKSGKSTPNMKALIALADYFDVSIDYLVGRKEKDGV